MEPYSMVRAFFVHRTKVPLKTLSYFSQIKEKLNSHMPVEHLLWRTLHVATCICNSRTHNIPQTPSDPVAFILPSPNHLNFRIPSSECADRHFEILANKTTRIKVADGVRVRTDQEGAAGLGDVVELSAA